MSSSSNFEEIFDILVVNPGSERDFKIDSVELEIMSKYIPFPIPAKQVFRPGIHKPSIETSSRYFSGEVSDIIL